MFVGWHQVAFRREIDADLTPVTVGSRRLMLVSRDGTLRAFDAICPHRGANLAYGGTLDGDVVVCPFHARRIALGDGRPPYRVREYPTLDFGGSVFVLLCADHENGLPAFLESLVDSYVFVPGFSLSAAVPPEVVIENVFDADHFTAVHGISRRPKLELRPSQRGEMAVEAVFETEGARPWHGDQAGFDAESVASTRFLARVFSPTVVATEVGNATHPQIVITAATPRPEGGSTIRVTLAVTDGGSASPDKALIWSLMRDSRLAFEQDMQIWMHMATDTRYHYAESDRPVVEYRRYCERFVA